MKPMMTVGANGLTSERKVVSVRFDGWTFVYELESLLQRRWELGFESDDLCGS